MTKLNGRRGRWLRIVAGAVALVAFVVLVVPLVVPIPPPRDTVEPARLAGPDSRFMRVDSIDMHYIEAGSTEAPLPIVLLHGFGASTFSWRQQLPLLADRARTVAFDRPAFGLTSRPMPSQWRGDTPYSLQASADQTVALMDELGIAKALLIGHSAGASVAVLVAVQHPDRVAGLILEAPAIYSQRETPDIVRRLQQTPQARRLGPLLVRRIAAPGSDDFIRSAFYDSTVVTAGVLAGYRLPLRATDWDRALWEFSIAPRTDVAGLLGQVKAPTLVIAGKEDTIVRFSDSERVAAAVPSARLVEFEQTGHIPHEEDPERFANEVYRFLDELPEASCGS